MKKLVYTLAFLTSGLLVANNSDGLNYKSEIKKVNEVVVSVNEDEPVVVYHWYIKTEDYVYTGSAESLSEANDRIAKISNEGSVVSKSIRYVPLSENIEKVYTWGVTTDYGNASGMSESLEEAKEMVQLMKEGDVSKSTIIESIKVK